MSWIPIGPDFIFDPRNANFRRLSRRNEWGTQGTVNDIGIDPTDRQTLYIVTRPWSGGSSAFRTRNRGATWVPIVDELQRNDRGTDPSCVVVNPRWPEYIYLGTYGHFGTYVSNARGNPGTWSARAGVNGPVRKLVVDARNAASPADTILYAATQNGIFRSTNNGAAWEATPILAGDITSFEVHLAAPGGTDHFYASLWRSGVRYTNDPSGRWDDLSTGGAMLPAFNPSVPGFPDGTFNAILLGFTPRNPTRAYAWILTSRTTGTTAAEVNYGLFTTSAPRTAWTQIPLPTDPDPYPRPYQGLYDAVFAVAPNSPGNGANDILFFGEWPLYRSVDGGRTWVHDAAAFYNDKHAIAFSAESPLDRVPSLYLGSDGGIARSTRAADPAYAYYPVGRAGGYDELDSVTLGTAADTGAWENLDHGYGSAAIFYYDCRPSFPSIGYIGCADTGVARSTGSLVWRDVEGLDVYGVACVPSPDGMRYWGNLGSPYHARWLRDTEPRASGFCTLPDGSIFGTTCNHAVSADGRCITGARADNDGREIVVRIEPSGSATQISQNFAPGRVVRTAVHPTDANVCAVVVGQAAVWATNTASSAGPTTVWTQQTGLRPRATASITFDRDGDDGTTLASPLYRIRGGVWEALTGMGIPTGGNFARIVADPVEREVLYVSFETSVYRVARDAAGWRWAPLSDGLPGAPVYDLWIGNIAPSGTPPRVLLRAALPTRGVWERDVTAGASTSGEHLYLRDNLLDLGLLPRSPYGPNPFDPARPGSNLYHYMCADIKVDAQTTSALARPYFQTDPLVFVQRSGCDAAADDAYPVRAPPRQQSGARGRQHRSRSCAGAQSKQ
jgi:hypothetical protein